MDTGTLALLGVLGLLVVAAVAIALIVARRRRREGLRERFGPEYDRVVAETGKPRSADSELSQRERRRQGLDITPLSPEQRDRYRVAWREVQGYFVDAPGSAIRRADDLVAEAMRDRGYPVEDFEQRAADISVDHPEVVEHYLAAHAISLANEHDRATTEHLREAMLHYRELFDRLLSDDSATGSDEAGREETGEHPHRRAG